MVLAWSFRPPSTGDFEYCADRVIVPGRSKPARMIEPHVLAALLVLHFPRHSPEIANSSRPNGAYLRKRADSENNSRNSWLS
jgi:hypothetical protein